MTNMVRWCCLGNKIGCFTPYYGIFALDRRPPHLHTPHSSKKRPNCPLQLLKVKILQKLYLSSLNPNSLALRVWFSSVNAVSSSAACLVFILSLWTNSNTQAVIFKSFVVSCIVGNRSALQHLNCHWCQSLSTLLVGPLLAVRLSTREASLTGGLLQV